MHAVTAGVLVWLVVAMVGGASAFLATPVNMSDPDVANVLCPDQLSGENRDHEWITREAIRRNIRDFFIEYPPLSQPDFWVDENASLTELFHQYYGQHSSPARFIKAVNSVASANVKTDSNSQYRYDPTIQADGEQLEAMQSRMAMRYSQMLSTIMVEEGYPAARELLGTSLHSLQKYYSHSNWVEQGKVDILPQLGLPGGTLPPVAAPAEAVCTSCASPQGECLGNVITSASLSSGYYYYPDEVGDDFLIPKPTTGGKCSHGGTLDASIFEEAVGGINKDTSSPCFSPHHHLHATASDLAVKATDYYLKQVLKAVGYDRYRRLFDLYQGSALSMCIDTTMSMTDDIEAVQQQVAEIVANTNPEVYIYARINDPDCGPVYVTHDGQEFLDIVNNITLNSDNNFDPPERFWCGLQLALANTPDYGDIICFTDAESKDGELMDSLIMQAQQQFNKVTVILSDLLERGDGGADTRYITGVAEYQYLADATGGLLVSTEKFDVNEITGIMGSNVENALVTVKQLNLTGTVLTEVPVEETMVSLELRLSGLLTSAILTDAAGAVFDLMDKEGLNATPGVELVAYTTNLKAIKFTSLSVGISSLDTASSDTYSASILAISSLDFLASFSLLDPSPPHPHYRPVTGNPLSNTVHYVEVTLVGHLESQVSLVDHLQFIDMAGETLREIDYAVDMEDQVYLRTDPLPTQPFYLQLTGYLNSGSLWQRVVPVQVNPVETTVEVFATSEDLSARPGQNATARFIVYNFGLESYFNIMGTDDQGFLTSVFPDQVYLLTNGSGSVEARFYVPEGEVHGTLSTVIVSARSQKQTQSFNSALVHFLVLSALDDMQSPSCTINVHPDCTDYHNNGLCSMQSWNTQVTLQDTGSGLYSVEVQPPGYDTSVSGMEPGTTREVLVDHQASCCTHYAEISGTDGWGNVGTCVVDMGTLGGVVYDFEVDSATDTQILLHWNLTASSLPVAHYNLDVSQPGESFISTSMCPNEYCRHYLSYLDPCTQYSFNITPVFDYLGGQLPGLSAYTQGVTLDNEPGTPYDGREIDATETTITVSWQPFNPVCSFQYEVCHHHVDLPASNATCAITDLTSHTIRDLETCNAYFIHVSAMSPSGLTSAPLTMSAVTLCSSLPL